VTQSTVTVLSDLAVDEDQIDEFAVARALEEARKALAHPDAIHDPDKAAALHLSVLNSMAQLEVKRRKKPI
jgi:F-type H+-transporting ATPase subunit epsilon